MKEELDKAIHYIQKQRFSVDTIENVTARQFRLEEIIGDMVEALDTLGYTIQDWLNLAGDNVLLRDALVDIIQNVTTSLYGERCDCGCH